MANKNPDELRGAQDKRDRNMHNRKPFPPEAVETALHYIDNHESVYGDVIPSTAGLAHLLGASPQQVRSWARDHDEFLDVYQRLIAAKARILINRGVKGETKEGFAKFLLGHCGYREQKDVDVTSNGASVSPVVLLPDNEHTTSAAGFDEGEGDDG